MGEYKAYDSGKPTDDQKPIIVADDLYNQLRDKIEGFWIGAKSESLTASDKDLDLDLEDDIDRAICDIAQQYFKATGFSMLEHAALVHDKDIMHDLLEAGIPSSEIGMFSYCDLPENIKNLVNSYKGVAFDGSGW